MTVILMFAVNGVCCYDGVVMVIELNERLDGELREMKVTHQLLKEQNDDLRHKMSFFIRVIKHMLCLLVHLTLLQENTVDWSEVEKAVTIVKVLNSKEIFENAVQYLLKITLQNYK